MQQPEALNADVARSPSTEHAPTQAELPRHEPTPAHADGSGVAHADGSGVAHADGSGVAHADGHGAAAVSHPSPELPRSAGVPSLPQSEPLPDEPQRLSSEPTRAVDFERAPRAVVPPHAAEPLRAAHAVEVEPRAAERERLQQIWSALQNALQKSVQREQFETWFRGATLARADASVVALAVQNSFARDWLAKHYSDVLDHAIAQVFGGRRQLQLEVDPELTMAQRIARAPALPVAPVPAAPPTGSTGSASSSAPAANGAPAPARDGAARGSRAGDIGPGSLLLRASDVTLNPHYRFDSFVVGPCNRFAHAASIGVSENPGKAYNPFFLHGSVGLGKTHLLQSLCYTILERDPNAQILYLSCETFVNHFISALETSDLAKFRNKYRNVDVLVVDDIHLLANKERTQEEFFHTFNTLYNAGKQIVLSSDSPPKEIPTLQERLVSRFKWGLVTEIEQPCYETRVAILKRKSKERGRELPDDVAALLADQLETNIRELEGAVTRLIGFASLNNQPLSCEVARRVLRDVFQSVRGQPSMEDIQRIVTTHFNVKLTDLQSRKRTNAIALPRQVSMFLARKITRHSLEEIGGFFGGRDHSTVLYAIMKVESEMRDDPRFRELVAGFLTQLQRASS